MRGGQRQRTGRGGEDEACRFLAGIGHSILQRNYRNRRKEIDIISFDGSGIHFVEVKSRRLPLAADPSESVTPAKQKRIAAAAAGFLEKSAEDTPEIAESECFFDVVTVIFDESGEASVKYYPQAFTPIFV